MTITQNVATLLKQHVTLELEAIDRLYLNVYVPRLQIVEGALGFIRRHRGHPVASTRMVEPITRRFVAAIEKFVGNRALPLIVFGKGQRKDEVAARFRASFTPRRGRGLRRQGAGEVYGLSDRAPPESAHPEDLCLDREVHRSGESLLLLLCGPRLRPLLSEVLLLLPLQRQTLPQRA